MIVLIGPDMCHFVHVDGTGSIRAKTAVLHAPPYGILLEWMYPKPVPCGLRQSTIEWQHFCPGRCPEAG